MRCLIDNASPCFLLEHSEPFFSLLAVCRQKALKAPFSGRQSTLCQGTDRGAGSRTGITEMPASWHKFAKSSPGSLIAGHAGIRHQRAVLARQYTLDQLRPALFFIVLMITDQRLTDFQVMQQFAADTGILCRNKVHFAERPNRTIRETSRFQSVLPPNKAFLPSKFLPVIDRSVFFRVFSVFPADKQRRQNLYAGRTAATRFNQNRRRHSGCPLMHKPHAFGF